MSFPSIKNPLVILPTYNEADNIVSLLDSLLNLPRSLSILVVDDGSPDDTAGRVKGHPACNVSVFLLNRKSKQGLGTAYQDGFRWALERQYDACVQMDADWSHDPANIPDLLRRLENGAGMAVGSRYIKGGGIVNWPWGRLLLSRMAALYSRFWTGLPLRDPTSGFKAITRKVLQTQDPKTLRYDGYGFQVALHYQVFRQGHVIREVPIIFTERRNGRSKLSLAVVLEAILKIPLLRLQAAHGSTLRTGSRNPWPAIRFKPAMKDKCE